MDQRRAASKRSKGEASTEQSTSPSAYQTKNKKTLSKDSNKDSFVQYLDELQNQFESDKSTLADEYRSDKLQDLVKKYTDLGDEINRSIGSPRNVHYDAVNQTELCFKTACLVRDHIYGLATFFESSRREQPVYSYVTANRIMTDILNTIDQCWVAYSETLLG
jgi:hypothetical protein